MTSRQARRERREADRKAKKAARKAALNHPALPVSVEDEFSPELLAQARAVRERIARRAGLSPHPCPQPPAQNAAPPAEALRTRSEINRANAAHSTGPRSPEGKVTSSRNSLKHGLASGEIIISGEDPAAFDALLHDLLEEHHPANTTEEMLIHEMAQSYWLTQRALRLQNECFTADGIHEKRLALFLRYQTTHQRAFHKALNTLIGLQKSRLRQSRGFVSQHRTALDPQRGFVSQTAAQPNKSSACSGPECPETDQLATRAA
ncbi:MAG: hypothetical protein JO145_10715 [Acidobacteriaceae bacterium]|nr:hypothetical protein [Acidobacteriaceae bacterium]